MSALRRLFSLRHGLTFPRPFGAKSVRDAIELFEQVLVADLHLDEPGLIGNPRIAPPALVEHLLALFLQGLDFGVDVGGQRDASLFRLGHRRAPSGLLSPLRVPAEPLCSQPADRGTRPDFRTVLLSSNEKLAAAPPAERSPRPCPFFFSRPTSNEPTSASTADPRGSSILSCL